MIYYNVVIHKLLIVQIQLIIKNVKNVMMVIIYYQMDNVNNIPYNLYLIVKYIKNIMFVNNVYKEP